MTQEGMHPDGKPWVHPLTRAAWRGWLIANHETSDGVHLVMWRKATGKPPVGYGKPVEEALCVGWRPETRARRVEETAMLAARNEKANQWIPPAERPARAP